MLRTVQAVSAVVLLLGVLPARADGPAPERAARLAEAERAMAGERWDEVQAILDELAGGLEVDEPVLAARLDLALGRAGLSGGVVGAGPVPPDVQSAAAALGRRRDLGRRSCLLLADEALAEGDRESAAAWLGRALVASPGDDRTRLRLALLLMEMGRAADAARLALEVAERHDRCPGILQLAGQALLAEGRASQALGPLERLVEVFPGGAEGRSLLGTALLVERRMSEAIVQLEAAVAIDPSPARRANLGLALGLAGRTDDAVEVLGGVTADHPDHVGAWLNLGIVLAADGRLPEARAALQRAQAMAPDDPRVRANLADLDALEAKP